MNVLDEVVEVIADARYASRGVTAFRRGGSAVIVKGGQVRATIAWIGEDAFVVTWEYDVNDWRAERIEQDEVGVRASMCAESLAFA